MKFTIATALALLGVASADRGSGPEGKGKGGVSTLSHVLCAWHCLSLSLSPSLVCPHTLIVFCCYVGQASTVAVYQILDAEKDIVQYCPFGGECGGNYRRLQEDGQGERHLSESSFNFYEWAEAIKILYPTCILAPVTSASDLAHIMQLWEGGVDKAMLGVFKDPLKAQECFESFDKDEGPDKDCYDDWTTFEGTEVDAKEDFFKINGDGYGVIASVGVIDCNDDEWCGMFDQSPMAQYPYAAVKCTVDTTTPVDYERLLFLKNLFPEDEDKKFVVPPAPTRLRN
jgi:hypothetical protein